MPQQLRLLVFWQGLFVLLLVEATMNVYGQSIVACTAPGPLFCDDFATDDRSLWDQGLQHAPFPGNLPPS